MIQLSPEYFDFNKYLYMWFIIDSNLENYLSGPYLQNYWYQKEQSHHIDFLFIHESNQVFTVSIWDLFRFYSLELLLLYYPCSFNKSFGSTNLQTQMNFYLSYQIQQILYLLSAYTFKQRLYIFPFQECLLFLFDAIIHSLPLSVFC